MNISIIGGGLAGLSCGVHLLNQGHQVTIFEKNGCVGGRANRVDEKGFKIDMGPTLVLMPEILQNTFSALGRNLSDYIQLKKLEPGYRILFKDGKSFDMTTDMKKMAAQIREIDPGKEKAFDRYAADVRDKFESSRRTFIERNFESFADMISLDSFKSFLKIKPWGNAYDHAKGFFKNEHLATTFSAQCLYLGQSPKKTPALYNLLAYLEFTYGIWYPMGGMHQIPLSLAKVFEEMGGTLRLNSEVERMHIENQEVKGVYMKDGSLELSDIVVSNRDLPSSFMNLTEEKVRPSVSNAKINKWHYGCSCMMLYLGLNKKVEGLKHHNLLLSDGLKPAEDIFEKGCLPEEPLLYVCSPTKTDDTIAPPGKDIVYILALVPNLKGSVQWPEALPEFRKKVFERLRQNDIHIAEEDIELESRLTPPEFKSLYGSQWGTAFGLSPDFLQSAAFRPSIKSKDVRGLYHVGASTHPGGGVPMVLTGGRLAAEQIQKDFCLSPLS